MLRKGYNVVSCTAQNILILRNFNRTAVSQTFDKVLIFMLLASFLHLWHLW